MKLLAVALQLSVSSAAASCMEGSCVLGQDETSLLQVKSVLKPGIESSGEKVKETTCDASKGLYPIKADIHKTDALADLDGTTFVESVLDRQYWRENPDADPDSLYSVAEKFCSHISDENDLPGHLVEVGDIFSRFAYDSHYCCSESEPRIIDLEEQACRVLMIKKACLDANGGPPYEFRDLESHSAELHCPSKAMPKVDCMEGGRLTTLHFNVHKNGLDEPSADEPGPPKNGEEAAEQCAGEFLRGKFTGRPAVVMCCRQKCAKVQDGTGCYSTCMGPHWEKDAQE